MDTMERRLEYVLYYYDRYCNWVVDHANIVTSIESLTSWSSFLLSGKLNDTTVVEVLYSLSRLYSLLNDHAYVHVKKIPFHPSTKPGYFWKLFLTVIEYLEVSLEITADQKLSKEGKWAIISTIQTLKTAGRLILLHQTKTGLLPNPPVLPLSRNAIEKLELLPSSAFFTLKSGKTIRRVTEGPYIAEEYLKALPGPELDERTLQFNHVQKLAEIIFILKPVVHLLALRKWGSRSYKPWFLSLTMDAASLSIFQFHPSAKLKNSDQEWQIFYRYMRLLLYILRSPLYDRISKQTIDIFFIGLRRSLPCFGWLINQLAAYLPKWQQMYFYMWSL
ncbi:peroxisomal membrane protein PEX16 [Cimex lectularius]|uniref:Peroxisomal membrane protein PEX16 n=1 Tax=Cimex lectularius TaxID=79782 RepID=A0A8I6TGE3_CIMLE|nr:peroxisomal membrane protein PEX16 [Cimex lectularius]